MGRPSQSPRVPPPRAANGNAAFRRPFPSPAAAGSRAGLGGEVWRVRGAGTGARAASRLPPTAAGVKGRAWRGALISLMPLIIFWREGMEFPRLSSEAEPPPGKASPPHVELRSLITRRL